MIFVTVGTQKYQFDRLLKMLDQLIEEGVIKGEIFAQTGFSTYLPKHYESKPFLSQNEFENEIQYAEIIISHAGVGAIMHCLKKEKKLIIVPRNPKYKEHIDGHQFEIAKAFSEKEYLLCAEDVKELRKAMQKIQTVDLKKYEVQESAIVDIIENYLTGFVNRNVLMVGSDLSVKGGIVTVIKNYLNCTMWKKTKLTFVATHKDGSAQEKCSFFLQGLRKIKNLIRKEKIQIVHIHVSERGSFIRKSIVLKIAKRLGCKVILHHHGAEFEHYYQEANKHLKKYIAKILTKADKNIVLSKSAVSLIRGIAPKAKIEVLYNAVLVPKKNPYQLTARDFTMLGRLAERKGTYELLETIQMIDEKLPKDIRFHLCGDGDLEKVKNRIKELGIEHRIGHIGWVDGKKKQEILQKTMCHVLFSYNEGLPMAILETMALGIVNVSTNVAAIPEVIRNRETGFLVKPRDKETLGKILLEISENEELRKEISEKSHEFMQKKFSLEKTVQDLEGIYERIMG